MAGPGGGPPRRRYVQLTVLHTRHLTLTVIQSLAKAVKPVSEGTFAAMKTSLNGMSSFC